MIVFKQCDPADRKKRSRFGEGGVIALDGLENLGINSSVYPFSLCKYYVK
ncbi:hypothetical protein [Nostoc sp.]